MDDHPTPDVDAGVDDIARGSDPTVVADSLAESRDHILGAWLVAAARQPFHVDRPDRAVADSIPVLFDAIVAALRDIADDRRAVGPMDDDRVSAAATTHAQDRFAQGLGPVAVVTEFRLLRQEMGRALHDGVAAASVEDIIGALVLISDAIDGAATIGIAALSDRIDGIRESFLATTVHDIRQPITLVQGHLRLAGRWIRSSDDHRAQVTEAIDDALAAADELAAMVETLSDAGQVAMGALDPALEPASLEAIVQASVEALGAEGRARLRMSVQPGPHLIGSWDPTLLRRVVTNLIGNAFKYSPPASLVRVALDRVDQRTARLSVTDEGIGLTEDERSMVFGRFVRTDRARAVGSPGLGLGLYACRGTVDAHGGAITIESDGPGQGTSVIVTLPLLGPED